MRTQKKHQLQQLRRWRIRKKIVGSKDRPRMSVCFTSENIHVQFVDDEAGRTLAAISTVGSKSAAKDLSAMLDRGDNIYLVDVREPNEYEIVSIPGATLIPKGEFLNGSALEKMPQDKQIVLHCKSGARSAEVLAVLKNAGFSDAVHVGGGVLAWVSQVDPTLPTY